jgi:hypothetical protein
MGQLLGRCGIPDFSSATNVTGDDSVAVRVSLFLLLHHNCIIESCSPIGLVTVFLFINPQNVSYNVINTNQVCKGPSGSQETWDNATGTPVSSPWSYTGGVSWGYACPWQPTDNPNAPNYPYGSFCVPYGNPDIGGYMNFDNILMSWIQVLQHVIAQDW